MFTNCACIDSNFANIYQHQALNDCPPPPRQANVTALSKPRPQITTHQTHLRNSQALYVRQEFVCDTQMKYQLQPFQKHSFLTSSVKPHSLRNGNLLGEFPFLWAAQKCCYCSHGEELLRTSEASKVEVTLRPTVSHSVCRGVDSNLGLATRYYFRSECCCLKFVVLFL
jgi:hypothetical protein